MTRLDLAPGLRLTVVRFPRERDCLSAMVTATAAGVPRTFGGSVAVLMGHPEDWPRTLDAVTRCGIRERKGGA